jgi:hypothetical protein
MQRKWLKKQKKTVLTVKQKSSELENFRIGDLQQNQLNIWNRNTKHDMKNNKIILVQFVRFLTVVLNLLIIILGKCVYMKRWMLPFFRGSNRSRKTTSLCSHVCTEGHIVSHGFGIGM